MIYKLKTVRLLFFRHVIEKSLVFTQALNNNKLFIIIYDVANYNYIKYIVVLKIIIILPFLRQVFHLK